MEIAVLGSGMVGQALATACSAASHKVTLGTRDPASERLVAWSAESGVPVATFADAAAGCELALLCTKWEGTENALTLAGHDNLRGKVLIDVTNPLAPSDSGVGLALGHTDSGGEQVQRWIPDTKVVKSLNVLNANYMLNPAAFPVPAHMFIAGNDDGAKQTVRSFLENFGWIVDDLGGIDGARLMEPLAMLWIRVAVPKQQWNWTFIPVTATG